MSFKTVEKITNALVADYPATTEWDASPFNWIRGLPPGSKGVIGRKICGNLLGSYGITATGRRYELRVNGQGVLGRVAMKWKGNVLKFQNVRNIEFDHVLCIGLYPDRVYAWIVPKEEIWKNGIVRTDRPGIKAQHKGADPWIAFNTADEFHSKSFRNTQAWQKTQSNATSSTLKRPF